MMHHCLMDLGDWNISAHHLRTTQVVQSSAGPTSKAMPQGIDPSSWLLSLAIVWVRSYLAAAKSHTCAALPLLCGSPTTMRTPQEYANAQNMHIPQCGILDTIQLLDRHHLALRLEPTLTAVRFPLISYPAVANC